MTRAVNTALAGSGGVLQVVTTLKTNTFTTTNTTFTDVTGLSASITPTSASSKILVLCYAVLSNQNVSGNYYTFARLMRDSTVIFVGDAAGVRLQASFFNASPNNTVSQAATASYLDSPASTASLTYKLQIATESGGTASIGTAGGDVNQTNFGRAPASIILMEIAG
jgi:hypothetical protein